MIPSLQTRLLALYQEAGGEEGLLRILKNFYAKMKIDLLLGFFFDGKNLDHIISQQQSFILRAMGKNPFYLGMAPGAAHKKIPPILKGHFDRRMVLLRETLQEEKLSEDSIEAWVAFEEQFRKSIVEEEGPISQRAPRRTE